MVGLALSVGMEREGAHSSPNWIWFEDSNLEGGNVWSAGSIVSHQHCQSTGGAVCQQCDDSTEQDTCNQISQRCHLNGRLQVLDEILGGGGTRRWTNPLFVLKPAVISSTVALQCPTCYLNQIAGPLLSSWNLVPSIHLEKGIQFIKAS